MLRILFAYSLAILYIYEGLTMAKDTAQQHDGTPAHHIHLVLQGKGGCGKSVIASWLAEFLMRQGNGVHCIDGDPVNRSLAQYKSLAAERLELVNADGIVQRDRYDALIERFLTTEGIFVVDSGATAFLPFWTYLVEGEVFQALRGAGRVVFVHVPIAGGEMLSDTLLGFETLAQSIGERSLVPWINEFFGPVSRDGKSFREMLTFTNNESKVLTAIGLPQRSPDTFGQTIRAMRERKLTFEEAITTSDLMLAQKCRLHIVRRDLFEQLQRTPFA
jgi:hypothetical protein